MVLPHALVLRRAVDTGRYIPLQQCHHSVTMVLQRCYNSVAKVPRMCYNSVASKSVTLVVAKGFQ
jgi:hypothetical protein